MRMPGGSIWHHGLEARGSKLRAALPAAPRANDSGGQQREDCEQAEIMCGTSALTGFLADVVERNQDPERDAYGEQENARNLAEFARKHVAQQLEHLEGAHEVPLGMNAGGRGYKGVGLPTQCPGKHRGPQLAQAR